MIVYNTLMFSSLIPKPLHSAYNPSSKFEIGVAGESLSLGNFKGTLRHERNQKEEDLSISSLRQLNSHIVLARPSQYQSIMLQPKGTYEDTIPLKRRIPNMKHYFPRYTLDNCPDDSLKTTVRETEKVISDILNKNHGSSKDHKEDAVTYVNYNVDRIVEDGENDASDGESKQKVLQIRDVQVDPLQPPKFKLRKNRPRAPSPPPLQLKSGNVSTGKVTKEDQEKWKIPAVVSNWKNNKGYTIPLEKRTLAASGGSRNAPMDINVEKFGELSQALEEADRRAREEIKLRNEYLRDIAVKEQREKENRLKELASKARHERNSKNQKRSINDRDEHKKKYKSH